MTKRPLPSEPERLGMLLDRLRSVERQLAESDQPVLQIGRSALCDEISRLSHRLHDLQYCRGQLALQRLSRRAWPFTSTRSPRRRTAST